MFLWIYFEVATSGCYFLYLLFLVCVDILLLYIITWFVISFVSYLLKTTFQMFSLHLLCSETLYLILEFKSFFVILLVDSLGSWNSFSRSTACLWGVSLGWTRIYLVGSSIEVLILIFGSKNVYNFLELYQNILLQKQDELCVTLHAQSLVMTY